MTKVLSIVVPTYNMEHLLSRCLDSFIVAEEFVNMLEVIVVNDGSKDNSLQIASTYASNYPDTFVVIDKPNGNYGSCINAALRIASGKYFRICDADDLYETDNLEDYISYLKCIDSDKVYTPYKTLYVDGRVKKELRVPDWIQDDILTYEDFSWNNAELLKFRAMHAMAIKTSLLRDNNYYQTEGISYTDTQFVFYSDLYSQNFSFWHRPIYNYYLGRDGQTMSSESVIRSHQQFFMNAERLINDFIALEVPVSDSKKELLIDSITTLLTIYITTLFCYMPYSSEKFAALKNVLDRAKGSWVRSDIDDRLERLTPFRWWRKYHIHPRLIQILVKIKYGVLSKKY